MTDKIKKPNERDNLDLLQLTLELYARSCAQPHNEKMHNYSIEARNELEKRLSPSYEGSKQDVNDEIVKALTKYAFYIRPQKPSIIYIDTKILSNLLAAIYTPSPKEPRTQLSKVKIVDNICQAFYERYNKIFIEGDEDLHAYSPARIHEILSEEISKLSSPELNRDREGKFTEEYMIGFAEWIPKTKIKPSAAKGSWIEIENYDEVKKRYTSKELLTEYLNNKNDG